jgi:lysophospholipase L1-like esterase
MKLFLFSIVKFFVVFISLILVQFLFFKLILVNNVDLKIDQKKTILILGDSQTETALNDNFIKNSVNLSNAGDPIYFNYVKLKRIIEKNRQIETVILGFTSSNLDSKGFYEVPKFKSKYIAYFYLIDIKDYTDIIKYNLEGLIRGVTGLGRYFTKTVTIINEDKINNIGIGGFRPIPTHISNLEEDINNEKKIFKSEHDPLSIKYFLKIEALCKRENLNLIVLNSPVHKSLSKRQKVRNEKYLKFIEQFDSNIQFWNYEDLSLENKYFFDENHLNVKGAEIFSKLINKKLIKIDK